MPRCTSTLGSTICVAPEGHFGPHRIVNGDGSCTFWAGKFPQCIVLHRRCGEWPCVKEPGHDGWHSDGKGTSFGEEKTK